MLTSEDRRALVILLRAVFALTMIGLTFVPIVSVTRLLMTTGADNLGNDYLLYVTVIDQVLSGTYNWAHFFRDSFFAGGHSMAIPSAIYLLTARFGSMSEYDLIIIGIAINGVRLLLLYDVLTRWTRHWLKLALLPVLSFLTFAVAQVSVFGFSQAGIQIFLSLGGFTLGLWGAVRFPGSWKGAWLVVLGGLISAWSGGYGVVAWPFLLLAMLALGFRRWRQYLLWLVVGVIAALPYLSFFAARAEVPPNFFRIDFLLQMIGLPLASYGDFHNMEMVGLVGLLAVIPGIYFAWRLRGTAAFGGALPPLILLGYSFVSIYQVTIFRDYPAPWYTSISLLYWSALVGLLSVVCAPRGWTLRLRWAAPRLAWGLCFAALLGNFYLASNRDFLDKAMYLRMRRPVSSSCLLYYRTAPTYCEGYLFQWGIGNPQSIAQLAEPLEHHALSSFAPHQVWTLQGDFGLSNVQVQETPGVPGVVWSLADDSRVNRSGWDDFRHLNLFLHSPNAIHWTISLPLNVTRADFHSGAALSSSVDSGVEGDGVRFEVFVKAGDGSRQSVYSRVMTPDETAWEPFIVPLQAYAGQTITLTLTSDMLGNVAYDWAMYQYPYIDVYFDTTRGSTAAALDLNRLLPPLSDADYQFDLADWNRINLRPGSGANTWEPDEQANNPSLPAVVYDTMEICLSDYDYFYFRMGENSDSSEGVYLELNYLMDQPSGWTEAALDETLPTLNYPVFRLPFVRDGEIHEYYYPVRLLELDDPAVLRGIRLVPVSGGSSRVTIEDFRLIRGSNADSRCPP